MVEEYVEAAAAGLATFAAWASGYLTSLGALGVVAVVLGGLWLYVNLYNYLPVYVRLVLALLGRRSGPRVYSGGTSLPDGELPTVDVFLPAYDEDETIKYAIRGLRKMDYPAEKFTIHVLVEASDLVTRRELARIDDVDFREVVVPPTYPGRKNKPRALNYAFQHTDGDVVGVLDAEDIVQSDLLRQAVHAIVEDDHDYVQGRLDMLNEDDGLLNVIFRGEYGFWYRTVIPSFFRVGYPVPLGGTTNFFRREVLESASERRVERFGSPWSDVTAADLGDLGLTGAVPWDPRNVTEDFELGFFLWESGYDMAMMTATTKEESPLGVDAWIRQRTRWQKGKLFTFYERIRHPPAGLRRKLHIYTQSGLPHLGPFNVLGIVLLAGYANAVGFDADPLVAAVLLAGLVFVSQHMVVQAVGYWGATDRRGFTRIRRALYNAVGVPLLWLLVWGADVRAMLQLLFEQHHWEKTHHSGRHIQPDEPAAGSLAGAEGVRLDVEETDGGWTWTLETADAEEKPGIVLARAADTFGSEGAARADVESFASTLSDALGVGPAFVISRQSGNWTWAVHDDAVTAVPPAEGAFPDETSALSAVARVKTLAGDAGFGGRPDAMTESKTPAEVREAPAKPAE